MAYSLLYIARTQITQHYVMTIPNRKCAGAGSDCSCAGYRRREFLRIMGLGSLGLAASSSWGWTQEPPPLSSLIPPDKKLDPAWIKSLFERGQPEIYEGGELACIGMPIGGICTGQLYLGGDGRLWQWDIFNILYNSGCSGERYQRPPHPDYHRPVEQGFAVSISAAGGPVQTCRVDRSGFSSVRFRGEYPIGTVEYTSPNVPVKVTLEAFSPFVPLNADESGTPATLLHMKLENTSSAPVEGTLTGWLENKVGIATLKGAPSQRQNAIVQEDGLTFLSCSGRPQADLHHPDIGTMGLALFGSPTDVALASASLAASGEISAVGPATAIGPLLGALGRKFSLAPGASAEAVFAITWHFPNLTIDGLSSKGRYYATKFDSATAVARHLAANRERLSAITRLWRDTWYDSTLPYWFLDRTFLTLSTLATSTPCRFSDGRFYSWEGVGSCPGTCTHVWHYAHAVARLFPELERNTRQRVDLGLALNPKTGVSGYRGEFERGLAVDGQAGTLLRIYREHQMAPDPNFLHNNWPRIKLMFEPLFALDPNQGGILEGAQMNTLDKPWFGKNSWQSGLYLAALRAGAAMALELEDHAFADHCTTIADRGFTNLPRELFDGEYFSDKIDSAHLDAINSGTGCEIDQVLGQSWAFQVGLPRVLPEKETHSALRALWKYNFATDVGPYRAANHPGRWYANAGEAGLLMCTFPRADWDYAKAAGKGPEWAAGYFNECMTGFEYQVAGHMIAEGMVQEGLAITRAIHDRYHPSKRNPWNEIECGDHYSRAMAGFGVFLAVCGYEHHGPKGHLGFAPKITPENFRAPFTTSEGWGTFSQTIAAGQQVAEVHLKSGRLRLKTLALSAKASTVSAACDGAAAACTPQFTGERLTLTFTPDLTLAENQKLTIRLA